MNEIKRTSSDTRPLQHHLMNVCHPSSGNVYGQKNATPQQKRESLIQGNIKIANRITRSISYLYTLAAFNEPLWSCKSVPKQVDTPKTGTAETIVDHDGIDVMDFSNAGHLLSVTGGEWWRS